MRLITRRFDKIFKLVGLFFLLIFLAGCVVRGDPYRHPAPPPLYSYWYYPYADAYYDDTQHLYYYYSGGAWVSAVILPPHLRIHLGHRVRIQSEYSRPYIRHHEHIKKYPVNRRRIHDDRGHIHKREYDQRDSGSRSSRRHREDRERARDSRRDSRSGDSRRHRDDSSRKHDNRKNSRRHNDKKGKSSGNKNKYRLPEEIEAPRKDKRSVDEREKQDQSDRRYR